MGFHWHTPNAVLLGHQGRIEVEFALLINGEKELIELVLWKLKSMHYWRIIDSNIENASFRVEKWCNILHYYSCDRVIDDIPKILEFVMPVFYYGQFLSMMEIFIACVPILLFFLLSFLSFWLILLYDEPFFPILQCQSKSFKSLYVFDLFSLYCYEPSLESIDFFSAYCWRVL